nr:TPA_exp: O-methyltransferase [uncultured bacterium]
MKNSFRDLGAGLMFQLMRLFYHVFPCFNWLSSKNEVIFLNLGYMELDEALKGESENRWKTLDLTGIAEKYYPLARMYDMLCRCVEEVNFENKRVVEIGCGHGGGAAFIARNFPLKSMTGIDLNANGIDFCRKVHATVDNLEFMPGDACNIPLDDNSCDVVINVESSHLYKSFTGFVDEVSRILQPGGYFLFTDARPRNSLERFKQSLDRSDFKCVYSGDIRENVLQSVMADQTRAKEIIKGYTEHWIFRVGLFRWMVISFFESGDKRFCKGLADGSIAYPVYVLQKH